MAARHVFLGLAFGRRVAEMAPAVDDLLGRAAADPELQPSAGNEIGHARVLGHVERVLVAHIDHGGADFDALCFRADCRKQREGRSELTGEMMHAKISAVRAQFLGRHGKLDGLQERVGSRLRPGLARGRPMAERKETNLLHVAPAASKPA
jgi:hypothetical protein